ncbi:uncharacterized protein VP01_861g4 [Puccinia sorghi]|uniref:Uncharacterized protein n=1 Tax=Puccinia sorghi TaxID=27349 RepID=A0A0L6U8V4_9BASI|nr:uncharacterized protein VP01_861g4 [Puccinia sorghi]
MGASKVLVDDSERLSVVAFKKSETPVAEKTQDSEDNLPTITLRSVLSVPFRVYDRPSDTLTILSDGIIFFSQKRSRYLYSNPSFSTFTLSLFRFAGLACLTLGKLIARIPGPKRWNPGPFNIARLPFYMQNHLQFDHGVFCERRRDYVCRGWFKTSSHILPSPAVIHLPTLSYQMIGARALLFNQNPSFFVSLLVMLSSQLIGYGISGLLRPILVYPSKMVFPSVLPSVVLFKSMYSNSPESHKQISFFKKALMAIGICESRILILSTWLPDEVFPIYMAPALQAVSPWCLTLPKKPEITQLFGGSMVGEGLGFLSLSLDWTIIGAHGPLYTPLDAQWNLLIAHVGAIFLFSAAYKYNWLGIKSCLSCGGSLPFISFELLDQNGNSYNTSAIINKDGTENTEVVNQLGLPFFSSAYIIGKAFMCLSIAAAFTAAVLQNWRTFKGLIMREKIEMDPHRLVCKKFRDFPMWAFVVLLIVSIALAFIASYLDQSGLSAWGLTTAILISAFLSTACVNQFFLHVCSLASGFFYGTTGMRLHTSPGKTKCLNDPSLTSLAEQKEDSFQPGIKSGSDARCHSESKWTQPVFNFHSGILFPGNSVGCMWFTTIFLDWFDNLPDHLKLPIFTASQSTLMLKGITQTVSSNSAFSSQSPSNLIFLFLMFSGQVSYSSGSCLSQFPKEQGCDSYLANLFDNLDIGKQVHAPFIICNCSWPTDWNLIFTHQGCWCAYQLCGLSGNLGVVGYVDSPLKGRHSSSQRETLPFQECISVHLRHSPSQAHFFTFKNFSSWGIFGKRLYGSGKRYSFVPFSLVVGFLLPIPFHLLRKYYPKMFLSKINIALIAGTFYVSIQGLIWCYHEVADWIHISNFLLVFFFLVNQVTCTDWFSINSMDEIQIRYDRYNYILSAALDGGTQMAILLCTFLFQGGAGLTVPFPKSRIFKLRYFFFLFFFLLNSYFLNPAHGPRDYCYDDNR